MEEKCSRSVRMAVGDHFLPFLTLVSTGKNTYYFCQHEKPCFPEPELLLGNEGYLHGKYCYYKEMSLEDYLIVESAIKSEEDNRKNHVNPYSFILGYCCGKGLDLVDKGYIG